MCLLMLPSVMSTRVDSVIFILFYGFYLKKIIIPYLGRGAAGENAGLLGSCILTKHLLSSAE